MALVLERLFQRRAEQSNFQLGSTIATAEVGQADGRLRVELPVEHGHQGFTHVLDDLRAAGGADGSQQFARVAVEHQGRRHGRAWAFARLYAVGHRLAVFCGDEREVGHLVVEQKALDHHMRAERRLNRGGHRHGAALVVHRHHL